MKTPERIYTLGIVGEKASHINDVAYVLAGAMEKQGEIVSGDYLDTKKLAGRSDAFHVGYYEDDLMIDIVNCPLNPMNFALTAAQAHRLLWVLGSETTSDSMRCAVAISAAHGIQDHIVILNTAALDHELRQDEEILDLVELEALDLFAEVGLHPRHIARLGVEQFALLAGFENELNSLVHELIDNVPQVNQTQSEFMMQVERCYSVKGPGGNIARIAFGPVYSGRIDVGSTAILLGAADEPVETRIAEIEQFGHSRSEACAGGSVSMRFHSLQKDLPQPGQFITTSNQASIESAEELVLMVDSIYPVTQVFAGLRGVELYAGAATTSAVVVKYELGSNSNTLAIVTIRAQKAIPFLEKQPFLLGNSGEILAWGTVQ